MSPSWIAAIVALVAALGLALVFANLGKLRSGRLTPGSPATEVDTSELDLSSTGPTIVHFGAESCGPCVTVRHVVTQVCAGLPAVAHQEIDTSTNPVLTQQLSVLSLPTTFIFDAAGRQRYRASGVPTAADLQRALEPLLA